MKNKWSVGSGKMANISSLNSNPLTNKFCQSMYNSKDKNIICTDCYSIKMLQTFRKNCVPKFQGIQDELSSVVMTHEQLIANGYYCPSPVGRIHSHGELYNKTHLENILNICEMQPYTTFTLWTKKANWVKQVMDQRGKPRNLILIYSNPYKDKVVKDLPKYFDKTFNNVTTDSQDINCDGKCQDCMRCYTIGNKTQTIIEKAK